jgi:hypothetical protein
MLNNFYIYKSVSTVSVTLFHELCEWQSLGGCVHVAVSDICGSSPAPSRSSRGIIPVESMRAWWQEGAIAEPEFRPAIRNDVDPDRVREPWWYAVRFNHSRSRVLEPLLKVIDLNYRLFTYEHQRPRRRPTIRSWLPGYFFENSTCATIGIN